VSGISECKNGNRCEITKKNRTSCKACRLRKCLSVGMSKSGSRYGRRSNWFKIHCLLSAQAQGNNNNMSSSNNQSNGTGTSSSSPDITKSSSGQKANSKGSNRSSPLDYTVSSGGRKSSPSTGSEDRMSINFPNNRNNGLPFPNLSPTARDQFLASLNRKLMTPMDLQLADYFRAANLATNNNSLLSNSKSPFFGQMGEESDPPRAASEDNISSAASLESPHSDVSGDAMDSGKMQIPPSFLHHGPGSPLDFKGAPNAPGIPDPTHLFSLDLFSRDLLKLGCDPLRLWPAMMGAAPQNFQNPGFNPYRFMFPNFPAAAAGGAAFAPPKMPSNGFPLSTNSTPQSSSPRLHNGTAIHPSKLLSAASLAAAAAAAASAPATITSPTELKRSPPNVVPPSSSLTLTPPMSHHGSDEHTNHSNHHHSISSLLIYNNNHHERSNRRSPSNHKTRLHHSSLKRSDSRSSSGSSNNSCHSNRLPSKPRNLVTMETAQDDGPMDLSAKGGSSTMSLKRQYSSDEEDLDEDRIDVGRNLSDDDDIQSDVEDLTCNNNNNNANVKNNEKKRRASSCSGSGDSFSGSSSPKRERVSKPTDLTRSSGGGTSAANAPTEVAT